MDQIGVVGLSYRHAGADDIAGFTLPKDDVAERLAALRSALGTAELVYLATCNRVEVVFAMPDGQGARDLRAEVFHALTGRMPGPGEARTTLRTWIGEAAVEHLFLIACGLDSAQAGEREIAAQLRGALEAARTAGVCGPVLDRIVGEALSLSGRLQRMAADARPPSLADLASDRMLLHLNGRPTSTAAPRAGANGRLDAPRGSEFAREAGGSPHLAAASRDAGVSPHLAAPNPDLGLSPPNGGSPSNSAAASAGIVAILGVSPMTRRASELLHKAGAKLVVVNRTMEVAEELARAVGGEAISLEAFRAQPRDVAGLIVATGGTEPVLDAPAVHRLAKAATGPLLIIDFGLPPNIDPKAAKDAGLARIGMDEMIQAAQDRRLAQLMRLAPMRAAIDERLTRIREQLASRAIGPQLAELRSSFQRIASAEADRAMAEELQQLDPQQQDNVRRLIETLAQKLAHLPLAGIRAAAPHANSETLEAFFKEARLQREARSAAAPRDAKSRIAHLASAAPAANASASELVNASAPQAAHVGTPRAASTSSPRPAGASEPSPKADRSPAPSLTTVHAAGEKPAASKPQPLSAPPMAHTSVSSEKRSR